MGRKGLEHFFGVGGDSRLFGRMMIIVVLFLVITLLSSLGTCLQEGKGKSAAHASTPPRGWNSYDAFSWIITEEEFLDNAKYVADHLLQHGYEYVVVDFLWYRRNDSNATYQNGEDIVDEWGRLQPDPARWPSSARNQGFSKVAEKVHSLGLKFGIHVMRGISLAAVTAKSPILGAKGWTASDVAVLEDRCSWMPNSFVGVNTNYLAGRAFILSLYEQYASWGVDFVKHDCVFGTDLQLDEIKAVSSAIESIGRPVYYSLSPGVGTTPSLAKEVGPFVNQYRVTGDTWDDWSSIESHFDVARDFTKSGLVGSLGLQGFSWPDLDMLPLGYLTTASSNLGPHRWCGLSTVEQQTLVTLWAIARSPLVYGGDLRHIDMETFDLITNSLVLEINSNSTENMELSNVRDMRVWAANGASDQAYVAIFNLADTTSDIVTISIKETMLALNRTIPPTLWNCTGTDAWSKRDFQSSSGNFVFPSFPSHGSRLFSFKC